MRRTNGRTNKGIPVYIDKSLNRRTLAHYMKIKQNIGFQNKLKKKTHGVALSRKYHCAKGQMELVSFVDNF